jgi:hypothetical protein
LTKPAKAPAPTTPKTPRAASMGVPITIVEASELVMMKIMPIERSSPPVRTGMV